MEDDHPIQTTNKQRQTNKDKRENRVCIYMNVVIMDAKGNQVFVIASLISAQQESSHHPPSLSLPLLTCP